MTRYWLDANVFIEAQNRKYPFGMFDSYWEWMSGRVAEGTIVCPKRVYQEIVGEHDHDDPLVKWFQTRKGNGLCIASDHAVQEQVGIITKHVFTRYHQSPHAMNFSKGADPWIIAHAFVDDGVVVTQESNLRPDAQKARIPDVCKEFDVACIDGLKLLEKLKAKKL